jgi:hypothetical protein
MRQPTQDFWFVNETKYFFNHGGPALMDEVAQTYRLPQLGGLLLDGSGRPVQPLQPDPKTVHRCAAKAQNHVRAQGKQ